MADPMKKIKFDPGNLTYELVSEKKSVFGKRNIVCYPIDDKARAKLLVIKSKYYDLLFANQKKAYLSRNLIYSKNSLPTIQNEGFIKAAKLPGNDKQIYFNGHLYLENLINQLTKNPQALFEEADKIKKICLEVDYIIPEIQTFNKISNWDQFLSLLKSIHQKKQHQFEFAIAAIIQYAARCQR